MYGIFIYLYTLLTLSYIGVINRANCADGHFCLTGIRFCFRGLWYWMYVQKNMLAVATSHLQSSTMKFRFYLDRTKVGSKSNRSVGLSLEPLPWVNASVAGRIHGARGARLRKVDG